jgi:two-component system sensor histidine kinase PilS (NtrC family)
VIIYSSFFLLTKGSLVTAAVCSLQYALLVGLEYGGLLQPENIFDQGMMEPFDLSLAAYKVLIITLACFSVALLSSILAEQNRKTRKRLYAMADHVKRVEQLAAVGEMAAALAHEIKNPLASLSGSIQLLKEDMRSQPDHRHLMHIALREARRLSTLVGDFLQFARPKTGSMETIVLEQSLADIIEIFKKHKTCRGRIAISCQILPGVTIQMDRTHFHQIIWNLLINAAEAIEGEGRIDIEVKQLKHRRLAVEISDSGCGMTTEQMDSIFFPFYTTKSNGTGLGLSIVYRLLESCHYRLEVESQPGRGSTFTILFGMQV